MNRMIPIHLEGYDINKLADWAAQSPERKRNAVLSTWRMSSGTVGFTVRLGWIDKNGGLCDIHKAATSAQEAAELAFIEFDRCNKNGDHN